MNDRIKHKLVTGQKNHQTADSKAYATVFLFFPITDFLNTTLASQTNGKFGFAKLTSRPFAKPKVTFFCQQTPNIERQIFYLSTYAKINAYINYAFFRH